MEFTPIVTPATQRNVPRELQARLYREIGVAAVAAALGVDDAAPETFALEPAVPEQREASQAA